MPRPPALFSALQMGLRFSDADEPSARPSVALPHAPESAEGMLTWLQSLAAKVRYTVAVEGRAGSAAVRPIWKWRPWRSPAATSSECTKARGCRCRARGGLGDSRQL